ncbi:DEAD/DEAH box helicase [Dasania marina]|uniref:DEAD/DEAH box helicase n=1 Tax=Dasania marina TaxID=471499 RepID=UPI0003827304|nr:DEAD/DEAH box helicase [Dasania marina]
MNTSVTENIDALIRNLEIASICKQFPADLQSDKKITFDDREINSLAGYSSILSLSDNPNEISLSYEIITRLIEYTNGECSKVISAADLILSRIGNFPSRSLLRDRHVSSNSGAMSPALKLESIAREAENTIYMDEERSTLLTDFQYKFLRSLDNEESLSVSAPTSAGKSFVLNLDLVRKIKADSGQSIVYVVPTRALISEVSYRIRTTLRNEGLGDVIVRTAPFPVAKEKIKKAVVYVLTQERLMSFLNSQDGKPFISSLIVDEAHEIQNGKRGIILQNAIDIALSRFNSVKILFASPLIKNPAYFLSLFGRVSNGKYFVEQVSPVSQNLILVYEVKLKPKKLEISLLSRNEIIPVGQVDIKFKFRNKKSMQRANLALAISSKKESVISFSNGPAQAENVACDVSDLSPDFQPSEEIIAFVDFLKREVHEEYPLAKCIMSGVAFHYGNMPSLVRSGVESLFKNGHIKIICCTSTLLQGVNLPAKHIIIENPMSGDSPMTRADFLNLAGRAGRLLHEFHGNIWCIRPSEWNSDCYSGERLQEISSAISNVMADGGLSVQGLLDDTVTAKNDVDDSEAEAAFGKLYHDYLVDPELNFIENYRNEYNSDALDKTINALQGVKVSLPLTILENNQSLRPDHLQDLYEYLKNDTNIADAMPMSPYTEGAKGRMEEIFVVLASCFEWNVSDTYMSWVSFLAYKWVWGESIGRILSDRVAYKKEKDPNISVSSVIRGCLGVLEEAIRFRLVKYFSAYIEILKHVATENGVEDEMESVEPYHIYLEFGSCNRHALNLMALGISRFTALHLENRFDLPSDVEAEAYLEKMQTMNVDAINMPALCKQEIKDIIS